MECNEEGSKKIDLQLFAYEKTEDPTPKHRREAREKGEVAKSHDVIVAVSFFTMVLFFSYLLPKLGGQVFGFFRSAFTNEIRNVGKGGLVAFLDYTIKQLMVFILPILGVAFLATFLAAFFQVGFLFTMEPLAPKLARINPIEGFKRIFSKRALMEFVKSFLKILIIGGIAYGTLSGQISMLYSLSTLPLGDALAVLASLLKTLGFRVGLALVGLALVDYLYQRKEYESTLKMTKHEVKQEYKEMEGDPLIKQRVRETQRRMAFQRMMSDVPNADVVVTNPDHIAVALKYESKKMNAPKVVAKGKGHIAQRIKDLAHESRVPIMENKPLARSLYAQVEIGEEIPVELYKAVAEILAQVYRLKGRDF